MKTILMGILLLLPFTVSTSRAEMYRWVDEKGVITFKDYPPPVSRKRKVKVYSDKDFDPTPTQQSAAISSAPATPAAPATRSEKLSESKTSQPTASRNERFSGTVEIYVTDWCGYCKKAIAYMKGRNIPFVAYDIEKDRSASRRHAELGGGGVPLIVIGDKKMSGFSPETLERYLGNR